MKPVSKQKDSFVKRAEIYKLKPASLVLLEQRVVLLEVIAQRAANLSLSPQEIEKTVKLHKTELGLHEVPQEMIKQIVAKRNRIQKGT